MPLSLLRRALVFLAALALAGQAAWAQQRYWEGLGTSEDGEFDIDIASIKKINELVTAVTTRHVYTPQLAAQQMKSIRLSARPKYGVTDILVHCDKRVAATVEETVFDKSHRALSQLKADRIEWEPINPGSIMDGIAGVVCGRGNAAAEDGGKAAAQESISGTGFVVSASGHVVTNNHLVEGKKTFTTVIDGSKRDLSLLKVDPVNDMALLKLREAPPKGIAFREGKIVRAGDPVVSVGYPLHGVLANEPNVTTGIVSAQSGPDNDSRLFQFTAPVQQGNSGGPLVDDCGNGVGMVVGKLNAMQLAKKTGDIPQNVNFALHQSLVMNFLRLNGVEPVLESCQQKLSPSETLERLRGSVLQLVAE